MEIIKKVLIKQIITEQSKEKLHTNFMKSKMRLEQECQQLLFEQRKLQNKTGVSKQEIAKRFQPEIKQRKENIKIIDLKLEQLDTQEIGSEIIEKELEELVELYEGVDWDEVMKENAIVINVGIAMRVDK